MHIDRVQVGPLETNCWVVSDGAGGPAAVIDPGDDVDAVLDVLGERELSLVILTHGHFDHLGACRALVEARPAPIVIHREDAEFITSAEGTGGALFGFHGHIAPAADCIVDDGDVLELGNLAMEVVHTPGHTPGSICLLVRDPSSGSPHLFSGDTLFAGSVGRSDFPRGNGRALIRSIAEKLVIMPGETVVHPGHGPETTLAREAKINPFWPRA